MKYYYKPSENWKRDSNSWKVYRCDHPLYNRCTLYFGVNEANEDIGLAIVQQHYSESTKSIWWGSVDPWIASDIFKNEKFQEYFEMFAREPDDNGLYYTLPLRKVMWALRMKPLRKEFWEEDEFNSQILQTL